MRRGRGSRDVAIRTWAKLRKERRLEGGVRGLQARTSRLSRARPAASSECRRARSPPRGRHPDADTARLGAQPERDRRRSRGSAPLDRRFSAQGVRESPPRFTSSGPQGGRYCARRNLAVKPGSGIGVVPPVPSGFLEAAGQGFEPQLPGPEEAPCSAAKTPVRSLAVRSAASERSADDDADYCGLRSIRPCLGTGTDRVPNAQQGRMSHASTAAPCTCAIP